MLDLIEDYLEDEEDELVDWISKFSESNTSLEGHHSWKVLLKVLITVVVTVVLVWQIPG